jgi:hypothetical protein
LRFLTMHGLAASCCFPIINDVLLGHDSRNPHLSDGIGFMPVPGLPEGRTNAGALSPSNAVRVRK